MKFKWLMAAWAFSTLFSCKQSENADKYNIDSVASAQGTEVFCDNWESIRKSYRFPEWFQDAKFGIFIHWGIYTVPAFGTEWYARNMYMQNSPEYNYHLEKYGNHKDFGYKDFIPMFTAEKFNADEWMKLFKEAGAKYVVPVAEHHDGFAMYDSELNPWNSVKMGPKRDILGLLQKAAKKEGMIFGLSTHRAENAWFYGEGMKFPSDVRDTTITLYGERLERNQVNEKFMRDYLRHTYELIHKYQPQLIWFDWTVNSPGIMPYFNKFMAYYYNTALDWGKEVVVNTKYGYPKDVMVWDVERGKSNEMKRYPWQTDTSIGKKSWSYVQNEENKTPEQIVHDLADIVSKNGNLLLNVGPKVDGTITEEQQAVLRGIGQWLKINGEAIYGTRPWARYGEGPVKGTFGAFSDSHASAYTADDIRFTTKGNTLYAISLGWTGSKILIKSLSNKVTEQLKVSDVSMLGSDEKINWQLKDEGLEINFPKNKPCEYAYTFKIHLEGAVWGEPSYEINLKNQLEISDYIYLHSEKSDTVDISVLADGNSLHKEVFPLVPARRNEYSYILSDVSDGQHEIALQIADYTSSSYKSLFPAVNFTDKWSFHRGDDMKWAEKDIDDKDWEIADKLPQNWETHSGYDASEVFGWYRRVFRIPSAWKGMNLILPLGSLDDAAEIYLNGVLIGKSGELPPNFKTSGNAYYEVRLPETAIKYDMENVLAIRMYDQYGDGGIVKGPLGPLRAE